MTSNPQSTDNLVTSRNAELDIAARKKLANSRNRNEALEVIVPRILGGIESNGHVVPLRGLRTTIVVAGERELRIIVDLTGATVCFRVEWAGTRVMTGHIHSNGDGTYLQRRVTISRWQRGNWQSALFDAFPSDSHRLLTVPVAPVLSEVGAELIRFLGKRSLPADGELF